MPALPLFFALLLNACSQPQHPVVAPWAVQFIDAAAQAGLEFEHYNGFSGEYYYVETFGPGSAFFDYDNDGWQDIHSPNGFISGKSLKDT